MSRLGDIGRKAALLTRLVNEEHVECRECGTALRIPHDRPPGQFPLYCSTCDKRWEVEEWNNTAP
ncbi:MAG: hypothetical protein ACR2ML_13140 [Solirubrobacteraceae bacterium]